MTNYHEDLLTICHAEYFHFGFNEQFIEVIDTQQTVRYNRSVLLVKHIRSTTHLFCKLYIDTLAVGIRVQTLISESRKKRNELIPILNCLQNFLVHFCRINI